jgi:hypothetical protein
MDKTKFDFEENISKNPIKFGGTTIDGKEKKEKQGRGKRTKEEGSRGEGERRELHPPFSNNKFALGQMALIHFI